MKQRLRQFLSLRKKRHIVNASRIKSAVLVPVYCRQGQPYVLFTRRTEKVRTHKGEISFPGGAYEKRDGTLVTTALRECSEEICLIAEAADVVGELDDQISAASNYIISPFVAYIPWPYQFKLNEEETAELIEVPISSLLDKSCLEQRSDVLDGEVVDAYYYHYQGNVIWGATARILHQFLDIYARLMAGSQATI